jgi:THO complex subunit 1
MRSKPLGSLDLGFLSEADGGRGMKQLKDPSRYQLPALESFKNKIALDDMEIDMPTNDETKEAAINGKASKSWRALRIASKAKLASFDKIEDPDKIDVIFQDDFHEAEIVKDNSGDQMEGEEPEFPNDRRPVIISGPSGIGKGTIVTMLINKHPKIFGKNASHTVRTPREGEIDGVHYFFVDQEKFNLMKDSGQFLEFNSFDGDNYGTSRKVVEGIIANGKIPIMEMDYHGIQQLKEQDYPARYVFLAAPSMEELERRLRSRGEDSEEKIRVRLEIARDETDHSESRGFHDKIIVNDDLSTAFSELEQFVYQKKDPTEDVAIAGADYTGEETKQIKAEASETDGVTGKI